MTAAEASPLERAVAELLELKALRDEELRLRQRRLSARSLDRVDRMREDYNRRKPHAWEAARAALAAARAARGADDGR